MSTLCTKGDDLDIPNSTIRLLAETMDNEKFINENCNLDQYAMLDVGNFVSTVDSNTTVILQDIQDAQEQLNELSIKQHEELHQQTGEGSDSGVEIQARIRNNCEVDDGNAQCLNISCDSSLVSCGSDLFEAPKRGKCVTLASAAASNNYECCSENGSESSSNAGQNRTPIMQRKSNGIKKKVALFECNEVKEKSISARRNMGKLIMLRECFVITNALFY